MLETRTIVVSLLRRDARDARRRPGPGDARDAGAARRRAAGGREPAARQGRRASRTPGGAVARRRSASPLLAAGLFGLDAAAPPASSASARRVVFIGVALLSPKLVPPLAARSAPLSACAGSSVGWRARTPSGNPGRTAVTAAALMIGVTLVAFVSIFAAGAQGDDRRRGRHRRAPRHDHRADQRWRRHAAAPRGGRGAGADRPGSRRSPVSFTAGRVQGITGKTVDQRRRPSTPARSSTRVEATATTRSSASLGATATRSWTKDYARRPRPAGRRHARAQTPTRAIASTCTVRGITDDNSGLFAD